MEYECDSDTDHTWGPWNRFKETGKKIGGNGDPKKISQLAWAVKYNDCFSAVG